MKILSTSENNRQETAESYKHLLEEGETMELLNAYGGNTFIKKDNKMVIYFVESK